LGEESVKFLIHILTRPSAGSFQDVAQLLLRPS
jgi:hypothetical protein